jgi:hypothetical protein
MAAVQVLSRDGGLQHAERRGVACRMRLCAARVFTGWAYKTLAGNANTDSTSRPVRHDLICADLQLKKMVAP